MLQIATHSPIDESVMTIKDAALVTAADGQRAPRAFGPAADCPRSKHSPTEFCRPPAPPSPGVRTFRNRIPMPTLDLTVSKRCPSACAGITTLTPVAVRPTPVPSIPPAEPQHRHTSISRDFSRLAPQHEPPQRPATPRGRRNSTGRVKEPRRAAVNIWRPKAGSKELSRSFKG